MKRGRKPSISEGSKLSHHEVPGLQVSDCFRDEYLPRRASLEEFEPCPVHESRWYSLQPSWGQNPGETCNTHSDEKRLKRRRQMGVTLYDDDDPPVCIPGDDLSTNETLACYDKCPQHEDFFYQKYAPIQRRESTPEESDFETAASESGSDSSVSTVVDVEEEEKEEVSEENIRTIDWLDVIHFPHENTLDDETRSLPSIYLRDDPASESEAEPNGQNTYRSPTSHPLSPLLGSAKQRVEVSQVQSDRDTDWASLAAELLAELTKPDKEITVAELITEPSKPDEEVADMAMEDWNAPGQCLVEWDDALLQRCLEDADVQWHQMLEDQARLQAPQVQLPFDEELSGL